MDEQRAWIRSIWKRRLRIMAVILCVCLLVTARPDILAALSAFATEQKDNTVYVSGFGRLPETVCEQTVPLGTGEETLSLPDTLEAFVKAAESGEQPEESGEGTGEPEKPEGEGTGKPGTSEGEGTGEPGVSEGEGADQPGTPGGEGADQPGTPGGEGADQPGTPGGEGNDQPGTLGGEGVNQPETLEGENTGEPDSGSGGAGNPDGTDSGGGEQPAEEENAGTEEPGGDNDAEPEIHSDSAPADDEGSAEADGETARVSDGALRAQGGVFVLPVYMAEPVDTAKTQTLERKEESVMIKGVTWQSAPAYDGNVEGTYVFTAVLPDNYALSDGVSLPQITVTVQGDGGLDEAAAAVVQALLERIAALPEAEAFLAKEPDVDAGDTQEAYEAWLEELTAYAEEALAISEAYEMLTPEQQAFVPAEMLAKLTAWVELAEQFAGSRKVMTAAEEWTPIEGSSLEWKLENGTLTIKGSGAMPNWNGSVNVPWHAQRTSIKQVTFQGNVESIGEYAFNGCDKLESVAIPDGVKSIKMLAFRECMLSGILNVAATAQSLQIKISI